ncbi:MAG: nucleotidyltransferase family protein [Clostridia bacterium]|nr:nucleotidyltransferase family protein [Clostridia bacterium]
MDSKKYVSVICEYNPFHFGHRFQMDQLKKSFDGVVCIMSGDIVQRGSVAVADKYLRAETALKNGADLVLELPIPFCCSSAREFARAGVHIADKIGVTALGFGAEDDENTLFLIQNYIESVEFQAKIKEFVEENKNISYPQALTKLIEQSLGKKASDVVKKPNNILSLEYLSALKGTDVKPFIVKREKGFLSSSEIRAHGKNEILSLLPEDSKNVFEREFDVDFPRSEQKLDSFFIGTLRRINANKTQLCDIYSTPDDLAKKFISASVKCSSVAELVACCTDTNYTSARVRRSINSIVFGIESSRVTTLPTYTTVLATNEIGREILRIAKKKGEIDIITKPIRALNCKEETKNAFLFSKGIEDIISLSSPIPKPANEGRNPFIGEE